MSSHAHNQTQNCQTSGNCRHRNRPRTNVLGAWGFGISLFGLLVTFGILCPLGLLLSFLGLFAPRRGLAVAGLIIGGIGTAIVGVGIGSVAMAASAAHYYAVEVPLQQETQKLLDTACVEVESYRQQNGNLPEGIEGNKLVLKFEDPYGNALRYEPEEGNKFAVRSAGADGKFDTPDDLRMLSSERGLNQPIASQQITFHNHGWDCPNRRHR